MRGKAGQETVIILVAENTPTFQTIFLPAISLARAVFLKI
jgi:hypothetical protein